MPGAPLWFFNRAWGRSQKVSQMCSIISDTGVLLSCLSSFFALVLSCSHVALFSLLFPLLLLPSAPPRRCGFGATATAASMLLLSACVPLPCTCRPACAPRRSPPPPLCPQCVPVAAPRRRCGFGATALPTVCSSTGGCVATSVRAFLASVRAPHSPHPSHCPAPIAAGG